MQKEGKKKDRKRKKEEKEKGIENDKGEQNSLQVGIWHWQEEMNTICRVVQSGGRGASLKMGGGAGKGKNWRQSC